MSTHDINRAADAELYARFLAAAMNHFNEPDGGTWHYAERAASAARLAEYLLAEHRKRYPHQVPEDWPARLVREHNAQRAARGEPQRVPPLLPTARGPVAKRQQREALRSSLAVVLRLLPEADVTALLLEHWLSPARLAALARRLGSAAGKPAGGKK